MKSKILMIDDDELTRKLYILSLGDDYEITEAKNAAIGKEYLKNERFDLILLDNMMPGETGYQLLYEIYVKALEHPPIIFLSAEMDENLKLNSVALGAFAAMSKQDAKTKVLKELIESALVKKAA